ncbi:MULTISPECIES: hypothetical protein [unclassified Streptomyces]|nr:hypothetical protein OG395_47895 [Streptomyces sp. NBC_01320]
MSRASTTSSARWGVVRGMDDEATGDGAEPRAGPKAVADPAGGIRH